MPEEPLLIDYPDYDRGEVVPFLPAGAVRILDVGCASGGFASHLDDREAYGLEPNPRAAASARLVYREVYEGVFPEAVPPGSTFDCLVFNDVLEHFVDPYSAVRAATRFLDPGGCVVASLPNMRYMRVLKRLVVDADWTYDPTGGVLDMTHLRWFTQKTMCSLFEDNGFVVESITPINVLTTWKARLLSLVPRLADLPVQQFVVVARPAGGQNVPSPRG